MSLLLKAEFLSEKYFWFILLLVIIEDHRRYNETGLMSAPNTDQAQDGIFGL